MPPVLRLGFLGLALSIATGPLAAQGQRRATPPPPAGVGDRGKAPTTDLSNAVVVQAPHMALRLGSDVAAIVPGGHVSLIVEFTPADKVHIYAPGQDTYLPIVFDLKSPSPFVTVGPTSFPPSATYVFEPTNEHFKVYSARTRLVRKVTIADVPGLHTDTARTRPFKFMGTLRYQACNDRVCFQPNSVAINWTLGLK
jgi:hypothetical protein